MPQTPQTVRPTAASEGGCEAGPGRRPRADSEDISSPVESLTSINTFTHSRNTGLERAPASHALSTTDTKR